MSWGTSLTGWSATVQLLQSIGFDFGDDTVRVVGPTVQYAVYHELGTRHMEAHPFARPAAEQVQANLEGAVEDFLEPDFAQASEDQIVRAVALAVKRRMQRIVKNKGIWDTGTLHSSISVERIG